jgi:molecular chaperone DnaK
VQEVGAKIYQEAQQAQAQQEQAQGAGQQDAGQTKDDGDDTIDADYEVKK